MALADNWHSLVALSAPATTAAVVKANAYGLGIDPVARRLVREGCHHFFVATLAEAIVLRQVAPSATIEVLNGYVSGTSAAYRDFNLTPVLGSVREIDAWLADGAGPRPSIHVDTGINRLGLTLSEAAALAGDQKRLARLNPGLLISHFACADQPDHPMNREQIARFDAVRTLFPGLPASFANSAALNHFPEARLDLTRPGIALYGGNWQKSGTGPMRPVVTVEARILQIRDLTAGDTVGYGATATITRPTRIALIGAGYADGYPRLARPAGAAIGFKGKRCPLVGTVSMDMLAAEVPNYARAGDWVELIGPTVPLDRLADAAGTIGYEILTRLGHRAERVYLD